MPPAVVTGPFELPATETRSLRAVHTEAAHCTRCPLYKNATQTVFGKGATHARVMLIGEQPGDQEDRAGEPFVGPAGHLLDHALEEAGIDRREIYVTNAVKHFKWVPGAGRRRLHQKPNSREIKACSPWLQAELAIVRPEVVVALGATAAQALMGAAFRVTKSRGQIFETPWARAFIATIHPSAVLRAPSETRDEMRGNLVADLKVVARMLSKKAG